MQNNMQWLVQALTTVLMHLPVVLISLGAIVIAMMRWRQAPQASLFCLLGFGIILCLSVGMPFVQYFLIMGPGRPAMGAAGTWMSALGVFWSGLVAVAYVLLTVAVFAGRSKPPQA